MQPCLARCGLNLEGGFSDRRCEQLYLNGEGFIFLGGGGGGEASDKLGLTDIVI